MDDNGAKWKELNQRFTGVLPKDSQQAQFMWKEIYQQFIATLPRGVRWYWPIPPYFTGYGYDTLYDWDQYFEAIVQLYAGWPCDFIKNGVKIFLDRQRQDGFIGRTLYPADCGKSHHQEMFKPFLGQTLLLCYHREKTLNWLLCDNYYEKLTKYIKYWNVQMDPVSFGLSVWKNAEHSGMDNLYERAGQGEAFFCQGVDLNCYLVREMQSLAVIARVLGKDKDAQEFDAMAEQKKLMIQQRLWDDKEGIFYDRNANSNELIKVKYIGAFAPLWSKVATKAQAERLVKEHLLNEKEFNRPFPIPGLAASEPGYVTGVVPGHKTTCCSWRAHTFYATNYYIMHGLRNYGFHEEADVLASKSWELFLRATFCEFYTSETGIGTGIRPFLGWTSLAIFMKLELELGVNPTAILTENEAVEEMRIKIVNL